MSIDELYWLQDRYDLLLVLFTLAVTLGLIVEYRTPIFNFLVGLVKWVLCKGSWPRISATVIGGILITVGVAGEGYVEFHSSDVQTKIRRSNEERFGKISHMADSAQVSALQAVGFANTALGISQQAEGKSQQASLKADRVTGQVKTASAQLAQLQNSTKSLETEANKTKSNLIDLAVCNAPRVIVNWWIGDPSKPTESYVDSLRPMAGQVVFIEVVPDAEARRASLNIRRALLDAKWHLQEPIRVVDGLKDGVSIQPSAPPLPPTVNGQIANLAPYWHADDVARELLDFLHLNNWQAEWGWAMDAQGRMIRDPKILPPGAIRIQVGLYPPVIYVSPPAQQEFDARIREGQEKADAAIKRQREEQLSKLPPQIREQREKLNKEWDAKMKKMMANGPCRVLNPLF